MRSPRTGEMMGFDRQIPVFAGSLQSAQVDYATLLCGTGIYDSAGRLMRVVATANSTTENYPCDRDYLNGVWTRYPCGVACGAGELVEQQKPLEGGSWTTSALYLQGISLVRRNSEWHHFDPLGTRG